ncbi:MAG TPA: benzoate-CoA ligase family protein [Solirubrobacteraceae bacterium]|nr:benzoate-CoA ligase family protein [Solirubrobacteraceae bacterium]
MLSTDSAELVNFGEIVDRQVEAGLGDKLAYIAGEDRLTYGVLRGQINRAANLLVSLGVRREQRILLVLDDTIVFPIVFLGALKAGVVPVPVSHQDKDDNFRHYVTDTYTELVVTDAGTLPRLRTALDGVGPLRYLVRGGEGPGVVELTGALAAQPDEFTPVAVHRDDMAFWLYSSGSTGKPKGVVHLHHDIEYTCEHYARGVLGVGRDDITLSSTKLFHAYGLGNGLSFPLSCGATAVLMSGPSKPEPLLATLRAQRPTVYFSVPALFRAITADPAADGALDSVRVCASAAEPLPAHVAERWHERFGVEIVDGIGSTEMLHIYCSNRPGAIEPGTTGRPVPGYELRLVDEFGAVLEGPAVGSLQVRGDSCAALYWHQHEKTKRCMRGDWFVSGDRYQRREDGAYCYVGRDDDMLKIGGLWVSPVDMESCLLAHPRVAGVGVIGVQIDEASRIAAVVECSGEPGDEVLAEELRAWCKERMRRYEYPHVVRFVDALPRTLTGKVQRFALRESVVSVAAAEPAEQVEPVRPEASAM